MSGRSHLILTLGKVIIAAAWADGQLAHEEVNSLKDLLFRLPALTAADWAQLEIYLDERVGVEERKRLTAELQAAISSPADKELALSALDELVRADGKAPAAEEAAVEQIKEAIEMVDVSLFGRLGRVVSGALRRRSEALAALPDREAYLEDFVKNKVYYAVRRRMQNDAAELDLSDDELRKLSLAGGLLARVAHVDRQVTEEETRRIATALQENLGLDAAAANLVADVAIDEGAQELDSFRLNREFFEATTREERLGFVEALFAVAAADGEIAHDEIEEIRLTARQLKLTHREFIEAKLKHPPGGTNA